MMFWIHAVCFAVAVFFSILSWIDPAAAQFWKGHDTNHLIIALLFVALITKPMRHVRELEWEYWFPRRCDRCQKILDECNSHSQHPRICCECSGH